MYKGWQNQDQMRTKQRPKPGASKAGFKPDKTLKKQSRTLE